MWESPAAMAPHPRFHISKALETDKVSVLKFHTNASVNKAWKTDLNFKILYLFAGEMFLYLVTYGVLPESYHLCL